MAGHRKVEDIHPAHVFLSLPDKALPPIGTSLDDRLEGGFNAPRRKFGTSFCRVLELMVSAVRHPGAFCHK